MFSCLTEHRFGMLVDQELFFICDSHLDFSVLEIRPMVYKGESKSRHGTKHPAEIIKSRFLASSQTRLYDKKEVEIDG